MTSYDTAAMYPSPKRLTTCCSENLGEAADEDLVCRKQAT